MHTGFSIACSACCWTHVYLKPYGDCRSNTLQLQSCCLPTPLSASLSGYAQLHSADGMLYAQQVLLDIGAGQGLFSLAAAARGHRAIAFELSPNSLASFEASMAFNGFQDLITLHKVEQPPTGRLRLATALLTCSSFGPVCQGTVHSGVR